MKARWIKRVLAALVLATGAGALMWLAGALPSSGLTAGAATALLAAVCGVLWWTRQDLQAPSDAASWYVVRRDEAVVPPAMDYRLVRLRRDLRDALSTSEDRTDRIYPLIRHLTAQRLRERHGIDLEAEPERAETVLSADLASYLTRPPTMNRRSSRREVEAAVDGIEQL
ncbi:hypothetical protein BH23ACT6_BH23ACT6_23130 [soil metagenome]